MWVLYELLYLIGFFLYLPVAVARRRLPHAGWRMRLGTYPDGVLPPADRRSIWVHAVSVGETLSAEPLVRALRAAYPDDPVIVSTMTPGGHAAAVKRLGAAARVIYFPLDVRWCVARAFTACRPRALLLMESELWPTVLREAVARGVPVAVVNGRVSARSARRGRWVRPWTRRLLAQVSCLLMQSAEDATRAIALGAPHARVQVTGNMKWDAGLVARPTATETAALAARLGLPDAAPVLVAGSTHRGEETVILRAFAALRQCDAQTRLVLAPRHLERIDEVERLVRAAGWRAMRTSQPGDGTWDVGLVDAFGQLPRFYALARAVFIGGSLIAHGGQNPLEAAGLGRPVVFGPSMHNFPEITAQLLARDAACQADSGEALIRQLSAWWTAPATAEALGARAQQAVEQLQGATARTLEALAPLMRAPAAWPAGYG